MWRGYTHTDIIFRGSPNKTASIYWLCPGLLMHRKLGQAAICEIIACVPQGVDFVGPEVEEPHERERRLISSKILDLHDGRVPSGITTAFTCRAGCRNAVSRHIVMPAGQVQRFVIPLLDKLA